MHQHHRSGSAVLFCIFLSAIVVVLGFGFLRSTMRDSTAGDRSQHVLLAQAAARAGLEDATEAILNDYLSTTLVVRGGAPVSNPPTFLDGPFRTPFVSVSEPNQLKDIDTNNPIENNDVRAWNMVINPLIRQDNNDPVNGINDSRWSWFNNGDIYYDGRGRYIEPNFHSDARQDPPASTPIAETRFLDLGNDAYTQPSRHNGLFLDSSLRRIASTGTLSGDQAARASARYRLRYAVGVIDLSGHLLSNPKADLNFDWKNANNEYRQPPDWLQESAEAWYSMFAFFPAYSPNFTAVPASYWNTAPTAPGPLMNPTTALRWQHVFLGRGNCSNFDRSQPGATLVPITFPLMFRQAKNVAQTVPAYIIPAETSNFWGMYDQTTCNTGGYEAHFLYGADAASASATSATYSGTPVWGKAAGGEPLIINYNIDPVNQAWMSSDPLCYALPGPQASWFNQHQSIQGCMVGWGGWSSTNTYDGAPFWGEQAPLLDTAMLVPTPFGRGMTTWAGADPRKWYEGHTTTPWLVNLLTAPPVVINSMLGAYLPPTFKVFSTTEKFSYNSPVNFGTWGAVACKDTQYRGHDLFTDLAGPAFSEWHAMTATDGIGATYRNFQIPDTRASSAIYPGKMWNDPNCDNLGQNVNVDTVQTAAYCSTTGIQFFPPFWVAASGTQRTSGYFAAPPYYWWGNSPVDLWQRAAPTAPLKSYWIDITGAFTSALAVTRAAWTQYPSTFINPATAFGGTLSGDPNQYSTIEQVDQLFLRQLGEDFNHPGNGIPLTPIVCTGPTNQTYALAAAAVNNTIRTLVTGDKISTPSYTSIQRGKIMERVLNDFRMSFFGSSPQYFDRFRPLDFDGDGVVQCSCYASSGDPVEQSLGIDRHSPLDPTLGPGRGNPPDADKWFSLTGTFFIGKSHFYRLICRGELFDNETMRPVNDATIESVLVVDPEGNNIKQTHSLFQRWHFDRSNSHLSQFDR